ncbi:hypothetical protein CRUP_004864 [Coryphaenoides rupestris]|nr:hypothetical protein CRUP_004864 [Coryphaenoides rupestris]
MEGERLRDLGRPSWRWGGGGGGGGGGACWYSHRVVRLFFLAAQRVQRRRRRRRVAVVVQDGLRPTLVDLLVRRTSPSPHSSPPSPPAHRGCRTRPAPSSLQSTLRSPSTSSSSAHSSSLTPLSSSTSSSSSSSTHSTTPPGLRGSAVGLSWGPVWGGFPGSRLDLFRLPSGASRPAANQRRTTRQQGAGERGGEVVVQAVIGAVEGRGELVHGKLVHGKLVHRKLVHGKLVHMNVVFLCGRVLRLDHAHFHLWFWRAETNFLALRR